MLLQHEHCKGKESFDEMLRVNAEGCNGSEETCRGVDGLCIGADCKRKQCTTYKEVCERLGLLQDDGEWKIALEDAMTVKGAKEIRGMFIYILMYCEPCSPAALLDSFWDGPLKQGINWTDWCDDLIEKARKKGVIYDTDSMQHKALLKTLVLLDLQQRLLPFEKELHHYCLHQPTKDEEAAVVAVTGSRSVVFREELDFDIDEMLLEAQNIVATFNPEQRVIYDKILAAVEAKRGACFYLNARGGCGKTHLTRGLIQKVRSLNPEGCIVLATATTGKAAMHLPLGKTFHSRFKAPLTLNEKSTLGIKKQSETAKLIREARLICVDEITMLDSRLLEALNLGLQVGVGGYYKLAL